MKFTAKLKLLVVALALAVSASLVAVASRDTNSYLIDVRAGTMSGSFGSVPAEGPYRLEPGASKARHWDLKDSQQSRVLPIAQHDSTGALCLDFGEEVPHNGNASPDVFRIVSLVAEPRAVSFSVSGAIAAFVTGVHLNDGTTALQGWATESVYVKIGVPGDAQPGVYTGTLTVHVDGWATDTQLSMTITVRGTAPDAALTATPAATPTPTPAATPADVPTPDEDPTTAPPATPPATPPPTPEATPTEGPAPTNLPAAATTDSGGGSSV